LTSLSKKTAKRSDLVSALQRIDNSLALTLCGGEPDGLMAEVSTAHGAAMVAERVAYHGVAGLLAARISAGPGAANKLAGALRTSILTDATWELRHRQLVNFLLAALTRAGIVAIILKGTALAYDLYPFPAARPRGDTDLLIERHNLSSARQVLRQCGLSLHANNHDVDEDFALQEVWSLSCDGRDQDIDIHWALLNAPSLRSVLPFAECATELTPLPRMGPNAFTMGPARTLLHACVHRAMHFTSPYFVNGAEYYGGDRLIWLYDIHLLIEHLSAAHWSTFVGLAEANGIAAVCGDGLDAAHRYFNSSIPSAVSNRLADVGAATAHPYFTRRQFGRALEDFKAIPDVRGRFRYFRVRLVPTAAFMRAKYPSLASFPLILLYARRFVDLIRRRP
jgi:hypothetical protein